jgi:hypothetical protein
MRVTVDLDEPRLYEIRRAWSILDRAGKGPLKGRVSSSGTGVHVKVHRFDGDERDTHEIRRLAGDDPKRLEFDGKLSKKPKQILFGSKPTAGDHAGEWRDSLDHLLCDYRLRCPRSVRLDIPSRLQPRG